MRTAKIIRITNETKINLELNLDGEGKYKIDSGINFFNHMLELFAKHGNFDLNLVCDGDVLVDGHHSIEDIGICLGQAFCKALGDKKGISRYGDIILPMDETLILCAIDYSGRSYLNFDVKFPEEYKVGDMDTELVEEFLIAFVRNANITLHIKKLYGTNIHHIIEGIFKALARTLRKVVEIDVRNIDKLPSTKGLL
ncbi:MAG: imidazoleglycerol-phosphate dehydratase HisB [Clostridia bacterium]